MGVPSVADLTRGKANLDALDAVVNGTELTVVVTPGGQSVDSVAKAIATLRAYQDRGAWATTTNYALRDLVLQGGIYYVCVIVHTAGTFATDLAAGKWLVHQESQALRTDLASSSAGKGVALLGYIRAAASAVAATLNAWLQWQAPSPFEFMTVAQIADVQARTKTLDVTAPMVAWAAAVQAAGGSGTLPNGSYKLTSAIKITGNVALDIGHVELDFSTAAVAGNFPDSVGFYCYAGALTALPALAADVSEANSAFSLASASTFLEGDVVLIYNPTDYSYSGFRSYYRAGEFVPVAPSSGTSATRYGQFFAPYAAAAVNLYLMPRASCLLTGSKFKVIGPTALTGMAAIKMESYRKVRLLNVESGDSGYAGVYLSRCHDIEGYGLASKQLTDDGSGTQYGWLIGNCQKASLVGNFYGRRHAVTHGGDSNVGCVPCREIIVRGQFSNHDAALPGIGAANYHGNAEYCEFHGTFNGGVNPAGDRNKFSGKCFTHTSQNGYAVYSSEMLGWNHDLHDLEIYARGNPGGSNAVVDFGLGPSPFTALTTRGGVLRIPKQINAPDAVNCIAIQNRGSNPTTQIVLDLRGTIINEVAPTPTTALTVRTLSGRAIDRLLLADFYLPEAAYSGAPYSVSNSSATSVLNGAVTAGASTITLTPGGTPPNATVITIAAGGGTLETATVQSVSGMVVTLTAPIGFNHADQTAVTWSTPVPINGWRCNGRTAVTTTTGASVATAAVTFPRATPTRIPRVVVNPESQVIGTATIVGHALSLTTTGFSMSLHTTGATLTNFSSATTVNVGWEASIED